MKNPFLRFLHLGLTPQHTNMEGLTPQRIVSQPQPLPIYSDINWYGQTMTLPNGGIQTKDHTIEPNTLCM